MRTMVRLRAVVLAVAAATAAGCGSSEPTTQIDQSVVPSAVAEATSTPSPSPSPSPTPSPTASPSPTPFVQRTGRFAIDEAGYAVTIPDTWFRLQLTAADVDAMVQRLAGNLATGVRQSVIDRLIASASSGVS